MRSIRLAIALSSALLVAGFLVKFVYSSINCKKVFVLKDGGVLKVKLCVCSERVSPSVAETCVVAKPRSRQIRCKSEFFIVFSYFSSRPRVILRYFG